MIPRYLAELAGALSFDRSLARRVTREVEDHLRAAIEARPSEDRAEAERQAIARFGDPRTLAMQFAAVSLARRTRRAGIAVVAAVVAVLIAMKVRVAWYAAPDWTMSEGARDLAGAVLAIDRFAFWISVVAGLGTLLYIGCLRVPAVLRADYCRQNRRAVWLCATAAVSLIVAVIGDGLLTSLRLGGELREDALVPLVSMAAEIACVAAVACLIIDAARRHSHISALLGKRDARGDGLMSSR